jgi:lipid-A-disaccharide synthase-like uncharacterized protein
MTAIASYVDRLGDSLTLWALVGFCGQAIFAARFLVQWMHSERVGRSEIPLVFWYISLAGGAITLLYAVHIANAVFIVGQASGLLVYARNLHLILRERRAAEAAAVR